MSSSYSHHMNISALIQDICLKKLVYTHVNGNTQRLTHRKQQKTIIKGHFTHYHINKVSMHYD